jgi:hypothetical protein
MSMVVKRRRSEPIAGVVEVQSARFNCDLDLHGMVAIRLENASARDRAAVLRQLGPLPTGVTRDPDLVIRFVDRIPPGSRERLIGLDAAASGSHFLVVRGKHQEPVRIIVPFHEIGGRCEIVCERGLSAVPLLIPILNLMVLGRGGIALHASAFRFEERDVLVTGWSKGGKTELLLGFAAHGARYIGDEWIYVNPDGERIHGIPEPIRMWDWHLAQEPDLWRGLSGGTRARLRGLRLASRILGRAGGSGSPGARRLRRVADLVDRQRYVQIEPRAAFGERFGPLEGRVGTVIFIESHSSAETTVEPVQGDEIADRMVFSLEEERAGLRSFYRMFRFAFPERASALLENASKLEQKRLREFLLGKACFAVRHPYPPSFEALFDTVRPILESAGEIPALESLLPATAIIQ